MTSKAPRYVRLEIEGEIAVLTLDRHSARNAIDDDMRTSIEENLRQLGKRPDVRVLILTGAGSAFCAGGDIASMKARSEMEPTMLAAAGWRRQRMTHSFLTALHELDRITIAAVNGPAMGLGCDLALCCDFVIASERAIFSMNYIKRGLIPDGGGMYFLPRRVGLVRAKELIYSGRKVLPNEALAIGMVDRVAVPESLLDDAWEFAEQFSGNSTTALALAKSILDRSFELSMEDVFTLGAQAAGICYTTTEHRQSIQDFLARTEGSR